MRCLALAVALSSAPLTASAQLDLERVRFWRTIDASADVDRDFEARIEVIGAGIESAVLTIPATAEQLALRRESPGVFVLEQAFVDAAELDLLFGAGTYALVLNGGADHVDLAYLPPANTRPTITSPSDGAVHASPGETSLDFAACAVCVGGDDAIVVVMEERRRALFGPSLLAPAATSWDPGDLVPRRPHTFSVAHLRDATSALATDGLADAFEFENLSLYSNAVGFRVGDLGIDTAPQDAFSFDLDDPQAPVLDPADPAVAETLAGIDVQYALEVSANGAIQLDGAADLDSNGSFESPFSARGTLRGNGPRLTQALSFPLRGDAGRLTFTRQDRIDVEAGATERRERAAGRLEGVRINERSDATVGFAEDVDWTLSFTTSTVDGIRLEIAAAQVTLASGRVIPLSGFGRFASRRESGSVVLRSDAADRGVLVRISGFAVDAGGDVVGGELRYRVLGQSGRITLVP